MDGHSERALSQIELAEAELAVLKQESVLRNLATGAPTVDAIAQLARLRELTEKIAARSQSQ